MTAQWLVWMMAVGFICTGVGAALLVATDRPPEGIGLSLAGAGMVILVVGFMIIGLNHAFA